ncbi:MAG: alpha-E domain-containing protein, partial [Gammaproteobacteria bacterium]|nr:alpha-E domain-containing protein [Gammaproteobacteria bacterium]
MLSRTADHLYWMSRYLERAESLARMIDAHQRLSLVPRPPEAVAQGWQATLVSLGAAAAFFGRHEALTARAAFDFLAFDRQHGGSIVQCLRAARENGRAVRGTINSDLWETLNATYIDSVS